MGSYGFPKQAEDAAHSSGDQGIMALAVRRVVGNETGIANADGDYTPFATSPGGHLKTEQQSTSRETFWATTALFTPVASATDMVEFKGSGTKTVKVLKIFLTYKCITSYNVNDFYLYKTSAAASGANTPGTAATATPFDSGNAAATAALQHFTALPGTPSTKLGSPLQIFSYSGASSGNVTSNIPPLVLFDEKVTGQPIVLRGTSQGIVLNNNGASVSNTSPQLSVTVIWTEE